MCTYMHKYYIYINIYTHMNTIWIIHKHTLSEDNKELACSEAFNNKGAQLLHTQHIPI